MNRKERRARAKQGGAAALPASPRSPAARIAALFALADRQHRAGRLAEAETTCRQVLAADPRHAESLHLLGVIAHQAGRDDIAVELIRQAIALTGRNPAFHANLGVALRMIGRSAEAVESFGQALALDPRLAEIHYNLGNLLREQGELAEAAARYRQALALKPAYAEAHYNLGITLHLQRKPGEAVESYMRALALKPNQATAHSNLGNALLEQGRLSEATKCYERALALDPGLAEARGNLILASLYQPGTDLADIMTAARRWNERHTGRLKAAWPVHDRAGRSDSMPRVGFVSGDFRQHVVATLTLPAVEALSRRGHQLLCYYNGTIVDDVTARFQAAATAWRPIAGQADESVAELIRADGIDILFDLSGMTALNRLTLFARKPAPIQVSWAGYPATTGLEAMDYFLADRWLVLEGADAFYQEKIVRLPDCYVCYAPPPDAPLPAELSYRRNGYVAFGSFNEAKKIQSLTVSVWGGIMSQLPTARLMLKARNFDDNATRSRYAALFAEHGVSPDRLDFIGWTEPAAHMEMMSRADIALDSFPYAGGATTLETLWMGVPVIACPGETLASRHAAAYLSVLGMSDLVARGHNDYVALAVTLANDPARLAALRQELRPGMAASPLCDADRFAGHFEAACRTMRGRFLEGEKVESIDVEAEDVKRLQ